MATVNERTIKPTGGGDYTTLAAWATARLGAALVDTIERAICHGGNVGQLNINSSITTDGSSSIVIESDVSARHSGVWNISDAHIDTGSYGILVSSNITMYVRHMLLRSSAVSTWSCASNSGVFSSSLLQCEACVFVGGANGFGKSVAANGRNTAINCIAYGTVGNRFAHCRSICCTAIGGDSGFNQFNGSTLETRNCIAQGCTDGFYGIITAGGNNISDISGDAPGSNPITGTVQFVDAENHDYHLAASDTVARGAGVNLTSNGITTDIDGQARPATGAWDIGADQYVAPAPTGPWGTPKFGISQPFGAQKFGVTPWM